MGTEIIGAIPDGTNRIGTVSGVLKTVSVTKVLIASAMYDVFDVLSESDTNTEGTAWIFSAIARANGAAGKIVKAQVISETTGLTPKLVLYLFTALPTSELDDNAANTALLHGDLANYVGRIDFPAMTEYSAAGDSETMVTPGVANFGLPLAFQCAAAADDLWGILATQDAFTQVAGRDMTVVLTVEQY